MGLDVSHGAFSGGYFAFNRLRGAVARAIGGSFPPHPGGFRLDDGSAQDPSMWYWDDAYSAATHPGLYAFLCNSDCDGQIEAATCARVADELEALLPTVSAEGSGLGHIERDGGYGAVLRRFIDGCRLAHSRGEALLFR